MATTTATLPKNLLITMLKNRLTDYNSTNRVGDNWIYPGFPRSDLGKNSYPRISVIDVGGDASVIDIGRNMEFHPRLQVDVWVWGDDRDAMALDDGNGNIHEGSKLADLIMQDIETNLDTYKSDFNTTSKILHDMKLYGPIDLGLEEFKVKDRQVKVFRKTLDVEFTYL